MKHYKYLILFVAILFLGNACTDDPIDLPPSDIEVTLKSAQIVEADNEFGLDLFRKINETATEEKNTMISPLSVSLALAMAYNGAEGTTKEQMEDMLHKLDLTPDEINQSYQSLVNALREHDSKVDLDIANAIFYHDDFNLKTDFINTNKQYYSAEVKDLDFGNSGKTLQTINGWVKNKTRNKIDKILDVIGPSDVMVLLNAVYFNAEWTYSFDKQSTSNRVFFFENGTDKNVPTMMIKEKFNYFNHNKFELLEMPYGGGKYSMLVFLPKEATSVDDMIGLLKPEDLNSWIENMNSWEKKVFLPKFEFAYENGLNDELKALGMVDAFSDSQANFRGITEEQQIFISEVKHKSYIKVDEKGTEAAAVTGVVFEATGVAPNEVFAADHPFVFAIREKDTNSILFIGKVIDPTLKE